MDLHLHQKLRVKGEEKLDSLRCILIQLILPNDQVPEVPLYLVAILEEASWSWL